MGFTITAQFTATRTGAVHPAGVYVTFKKSCQASGNDMNSTVSTLQAGSSGTPLQQRVPLVAGDTFATSGAGDYLLLTAGNGAVYTVWFNVDEGNSAPVVADTTLVEVNVASSDTVGQVASKTASVLTVAHSGVFTVSANTNSDSYINVTNVANGDVAVADLTDMPRYARYYCTGTWSLYSSFALSKTKQPIETGQFSINQGRPFSSPYLVLLYAGLKLDAQFSSYTASIVDDL